MKNIYTIFCLILLLPGCKLRSIVSDFPEEMVSFTPYKGNPVFKGTDTNTWDRTIRERGYILLEDGKYKLWYTGYNKKDSDPKSLGYATSDDGIQWKRYPSNPIFSEKWTEDVFVQKVNEKYYMYAEGKNDIAHLLTSDDGINWQEQGDLIIRKVNGDTISGPYGTPNIFIEKDIWYLFYERNDEGIWIAESDDHRTWTNIQDEPVLKRGPEKYDQKMLAANQVVRFRDRYYMFYHATAEDGTGIWTSNVAMSEDLMHWIKYPGNPVIQGDHSSPVLVFDGKKYRLYAMHPSVCLYLPSDFLQADYKGTPFSDNLYKGGPQEIPGKLQCEYYDFGGEGIAYHDSDTINSGSGKLNPADGSYLHDFRMKEAVDISFTKFKEPPIDNNAYNFVQPEKDQLYIGWTQPGEWTKYTIIVKKTGIYKLGIMYTSNQNGKISFDVNDKDATGPITIPTTFNQADTVAWRQWHHWNYIDNIAQITLKKGLQTITLRTVEIGQMNYDYINFAWVK